MSTLVCYSNSHDDIYSNGLIHLLPIVRTVKPPSASEKETTSEQENCFSSVHVNTPKNVPESSLQEKPPDNFFEITVPRSDLCSKKSVTSGNQSESFDIIAIETRVKKDRLMDGSGHSYYLVIACQNVSDFKNNSQSTVVLIKRWSNAGSIKVKLATHSLSVPFLDVGVLSHPSAGLLTTLNIDIGSLMMASDTGQETRSLEFFYSEAGSDEQTLFTLPLAIYFFPFLVTPAKSYFFANRSQSDCVAIDVRIDSEEDFRLLVEIVSTEMKIFISKMILNKRLANLKILKNLPQYTANVAHLDARQCKLDADEFAALVEIYPSIDEISCHAITNDKEEFFKLVAVINGRKNCRVKFSILQLNLDAFTDLEAGTDLWPNLNLQIDKLHLKLSYTDITSLTVLLTKLHGFTILTLQVEKFVTNSNILPLPVFSIQRIIPPSNYIHLNEIEISDFANPILMDDFLLLRDCEKIRLTNVVLEFSSLEKLQQFSNLKSDLSLDTFTVKVNGKEDKNGLILMITKINKKQDVKRIVNEADKSISSFKCEWLRSYGNTIQLRGIITAFSCETLIQFCCEWIVDPALDVNFSSLKLQCLTPQCSKCSLLIIFLSFKNSDKTPKLLNVIPRGSISDVTWLLNQLLLHHPSEGKYCEPIVYIREFEIFIRCYEPRSSITEILIPCLHCLRRFGIEIERLKLLVDQDKSGWSFIRLCSTEFQVNVEFENGIKVEVPPQATESMITMECFAIPQKATTLEDESSFPIISLDQLGSSSFVKCLSVKFPVFLRGRYFTWKSLCIREPRLIYPTGISECEALHYVAHKNLPSNFVEKCRDAQTSCAFYIINCAYVCVYPDKTNSDVINFDCLCAFGQNKLGQSKFLPFCEIKKIHFLNDEKLSLELQGNICFVGNSAVSQIEFLNPFSKKEIHTFKMKLIDPSLEPKCTIIYRVDSSGSESGSFDFQWSETKRVQSIPELQELFASDAQSLKLPLSLLAIDLKQLNASELDLKISENNLLCKVDLLDVFIKETSCEALNMLSKKLQSLRITLSVEELVEAEKETSIVPFNNLLKSSVLSPNLTSVKLSCPNNVLHIENLFQILIDSSDTHNISELHFSRVQLALSSQSKIQQFCENLETYSAIRSDFVFSIDNSEAIIEPFNINVNLNLLMNLTMGEKSLTEGLRLMESTNFQINDQKGVQRIEKLRLEFKQSVFSTIDIAGVIVAPTFEDVSMLCKVWQVKSEFIHCQNLHFKCLENQIDSNLLSLFFALSNVNAVGGDDLDCLFFKNSFSMTSLSYLNKFMTSADILSNFRQNEVVATNLKVGIQCHESRCEFFRLQTQTLSSLKKIGISFQSVLVSVESDDTNWAYVKIRLTSEKHRIQFSNEVIVTFPTNCTKGPRTVSIEVHPIPDEVIKRVCAWYGTDATCHVSPVVFIDQIDDTPFLEDVCVQVPYSSSDLNVCGERLFTEAFSKRCYEQDWSLVAKEKLQKNWYTLTYNSKHFSPFSVLTSVLQKVFKTSDFSDAYFPNCVYVTVQTLDHKPRNVKFNCIKVQNEKEWKDLKVMTQLECKKVGLMDRDDVLFADLAPNLRIDDFFHPEEANERLRFSCPEDDQNEQEYIMKKVILDQEHQGIVIYYLNRAGVETKLSRPIVYFVPNLKGANVLNVMRDVGCGPENPEMNRDGDPHGNLEIPLEAAPVPEREPQLDEPEMNQHGNNPEPNLDPESNWVIGPQLNPPSIDQANGPQINPREVSGPGMDSDGCIRSDALEDR